MRIPLGTCISPDTIFHKPDVACVVGLRGSKTLGQNGNNK